MTNFDEILSDLTPATPEEIAKGDSISQKIVVAALRSRGFSMEIVEEVLIEYRRIVDEVIRECFLDFLENNHVP